MKYILRKANKTNTSLTVTIPKWIVEKLSLKAGDIMQFDLISKKIIIRKEERRENL